MMEKYLVDVNLPYYFSLWNSMEYIHQLDIQADSEDWKIWDYAQNKHLTIITKDADFSERILFSSPPPRIIHIRLGNMRMREFHRIISFSWSEICQLSKENKLVSVYSDRIETIV